jgi:hypothetical protein
MLGWVIERETCYYTRETWREFSSKFDENEKEMMKVQQQQRITLQEFTSSSLFYDTHELAM